MPQLQRYLPIVESGKETKILGLVDLGANVSFEGNETALAHNNSAGTSVPLVINKLVPPVSLNRQQNPWFMAVVVTAAEAYNKAYFGYKFVPIKDVLPGAQWSSGSGAANVLTTFDGLILRGLTSDGGFSA